MSDELRKAAQAVLAARDTHSWSHQLHNAIEELRAALAAPATTPDELERLRKDAEQMREALMFYAEGDHFTFDRDAWDTVSDEPQNYWCDEAGTATVEDGTIAKLALDAAMKGTL